MILTLIIAIGIITAAVIGIDLYRARRRTKRLRKELNKNWSDNKYSNNNKNKNDNGKQ